MSLTVEEIQKTLTESMRSMQESMERERTAYKSKIEGLEQIIRDKENLIKDITKKKSKDIIIKNLEQENEKLKRSYEEKEIDYKSAVMSVSTLNNQIEIKGQTIMQLNLDKKNLEQKLEEKEKEIGELNEKIKRMNNDNNNILDNIKIK